MDWTSLISVALGGLIATIPVLISNRYQAQERQKDREEQRRDARIQAREKWIEQDLLRIRDLLDKVMSPLTEEKRISLDQIILENKETAGLITNDEYIISERTLAARVSERFGEISNTVELMSRLVTSFGKPIVTIYNKFVGAVREWKYIDLNFPAEEKAEREKRIDECWREVNISAGYLHRAIRQELISIRETED
jgi:hypothetical protein